jgi:hypothetical protein
MVLPRKPGNTNRDRRRITLQPCDEILTGLNRRLVEDTECNLLAATTLIHRPQSPAYLSAYDRRSDRSGVDDLRQRRCRGGAVGRNRPVHSSLGTEVTDRKAFADKIAQSGGRILSRPAAKALKFRAPDGNVAEVIDTGALQNRKAIPNVTAFSGTDVSVPLATIPPAPRGSGHSGRHRSRSNSTSAAYAAAAAR